MNIKLRDLLPEEISDETAYHLVNFMINLASELDVHYFGQMKRYVDNNIPAEPPDFLQHKNNVEDSFKVS